MNGFAGAAPLDDTHREQCCEEERNTIDATLYNQFNAAIPIDG